MREERTGKRKPRGRPNILGLITETRYPDSAGMWDSLSQDDINEAIEKCMWRTNQFGVDLCTGNPAPCYIEICNGTCDALKQLFAARKKEKSDEE